MFTVKLPIRAERDAAEAGDGAVWWVLAYVALLPLPGVAEIILALGAAFAVIRLLQWRARGVMSPLLRPEAWGLTCLLFLAYWVPQAVAAIDAVDPGKAWSKALGALRYLPFMWLVAIAVATAQRRKWLFNGVAWIALYWAMDALLQWLTGASPTFVLLQSGKAIVSGEPLCPVEQLQAVGRYNGIFSECNPKLGQVLAVFSPFALLLARGRHVWWIGLALILGVAILLAGSRAAWISYALVVLLMGRKTLGARRLMTTAGVSMVCLGVMVAVMPSLNERLERSAAVFNQGGGGVDQAMTGRGRIWSGAVCMIAEHPINGVGVRGFRHAWAGCDPSPGVRPEWGEGPALHAHQLVLEILSETGLVGLMLWMAGAALSIRAWRFADRKARSRALPAAVAAGVAVFPFNTHLAVYSAFWGGITMLLIALYVGSLLARD